MNNSKWSGASADHLARGASSENSSLPCLSVWVPAPFPQAEDVGHHAP
jgi:hypothetical protein